MAIEGGEWGTIIGVLVIVLAMFGYSHFAGLRAAPARKDDGPSVNPMLSRFVVHEGDVIGEVMAVDDEQIVVKHQGKFQAFGLDVAALKNDEVHLVGNVDFDAAAAAGDAWLAANRKGQDDAVTPQLSTSADIKNPAREAFDDRDGEEE